MGWKIPKDIYADFTRLANNVVKGWWDTESRIVLDGNKITTINDQSGNNNHATQIASVRQPEFVEYNGEFAAQLSANKYFNADGVSFIFNQLDAAYTKFDLYVVDNPAGPRACLGGSGLLSSINKYFISGYNNMSGVISSERFDTGTSVIVEGDDDITSETDYVLLTERCTGTLLDYWINGNSDTGIAPGGDSFSNPLNSQDLYTVGALRRGAAAATNFCFGKLRIQVVCDKVLSDPERVWVENAILERRFLWSFILRR